MSFLMKGFPPSDEAQVTLANWRTGPFCHWAFHHVREIVPSANISNDPANIWTLEEAVSDFSSIRFNLDSGEQVSLGQYHSYADTDAFVVLHKGKLVHEAYPREMTAKAPHILMSVSKSVTAIVAGIAISEGHLGENDTIEEHVPEIAATAFSGSTVRDLLDMRVGVKFNEDYLAMSGAIIEYRKASNWNPAEPGDENFDLRSFLATLRDVEQDYTGYFHYVSPCSDLLGWVLERATGQRFSEYLSQKLWQPMGAEFPAYITVDRLGAPRVAGGICVAARDLARLGQLVALGGRRDGRQIIPSVWIDDIFENGDVQAWESGDFSQDFPGMDMHYRSKWYVIRGDAPIMFGIGIHGQYVFVDRSNDIVVALLSSQPEPINAVKIRNAVNLAHAITDHLLQ